MIWAKVAKGAFDISVAHITLPEGQWASFDCGPGGFHKGRNN